MASAVTSPVATVISSSQINLSWVNHGPYDGLVLYRNGVFYETLSVSATSKNVTGLTDGTSYTFRIDATYGEDGWSTSFAARVTILAPPTGISFVPHAYDVHISWNDNSSAEASYKIYRNGTLIYTTAANAETYTDSGLDHATHYDYEIKAYNSAYGLSTGLTGHTNTLSPPVAPSLAEATVIDHQGIELTWQDNSSNEHGFYIYRKVSGGSYSLIETTVANVEAYTDNGLDYNTEYIYKVTAFDENGESVGSVTAAVITDDHIAWVKLNLGAGNARVITRVAFKTDAANFNGFTVHGSNNDSAWTLLYTGVAASSTALQTFDFVNIVAYRYIKLTNTSNHAHNAMKIYTLNAYEIPYANEWLKFDCGSGVSKTPVRIIIQPKSSGVEDWELYGSSDGTTWALITSGKCVSGESENEFIFVNSTAYRHFKLLVLNSYAGIDIGVIEWKLYEYAAAADLNYYLFRKETDSHILRRVLFPDIDSMEAFITAWGTENPSWDHAAFVVPTTDVSIANNTITITSHGLKEHDRVLYTKGAGTAIPELTTATNYYVRDVTAHTFTLAATWAGDALDLTGTGNNAQSFTPSTYAFGGCSFDDMYDNGDVAAKVTVDGYTITEATLDGLIQETLSLLSLSALYDADGMFGIPAAYEDSLPITGPTSIHELKRRDLEQVFSSGAWEDADPEKYIQNKFVFVTAGENLLKANLDDEGDIQGFEIIGTDLKEGTEPSWANFQNRAFMTNGNESDCDKIWTDGEEVYPNGIEIPTLVTNGTVKTFDHSAVNLTNNTITLAAHGLYNQQRVVYANGDGSDIGGLTEGTTYFIIVSDVNTIKLSTSAGGNAIDLNTSDGGGTNQTLTVTSITKGTSGSMSDGTYYLKIRYRRTTYGGCSSNPSAEFTVVLTGGGANQDIVLDVLRSADLQVDKIDIYRTKIGDGIFYNAVEAANTPIADTVVQISVTLADNALGAGDLEEDNDTAPNALMVTCFGAINRMGYLTNGGLYFSKAGHPENVPLENYIPMGEDDGQFFTGMVVVGDWCFVGKEGSIYVVDLNNITQLQAICLSSTVGVLDWKALVVIEDGQLVMWPSKLGFNISDGVKITNLSRGHSVVGDSGEAEVGGRNFDDFVRNFDFSRKSECSAIFLPKRQLYLCMSPYIGEDIYEQGNYRLWCYDIVKGSFFKWDFPIPPVRLFSLTDKNNIVRVVSSFTQIFNDEYYGYFLLLDDESDYHDTVSISFAGVEEKQDITWVLATTWTDLGLPERIKLMRMLYAQVYATGEVTIEVKVGIDHKRFLRNQSVTIADFDSPTGLVHEGETGTAPLEGEDKIEGFDYGRVKNIPIPVDAVGTEFALYLTSTNHELVKLLGFAELFRIRGGRP